MAEPGVPTPAPEQLPAFDMKAGQVIQVPHADLAKQFLAGNVGLVTEHKYDLVGPSGQVYTAPATSVAEALRNGYRFATRTEVADSDAQGTGAGVRAALEGAAEAIPGGKAMLVAAGADPEGIKARERAHPIMRYTGMGAALLGGGELLGAGKLGGLVLGDITAARGAAATAATLGERVVAGATGAALENAVVGAGNFANEAALGQTDVSAESFIAHAGMYAFTGGMLGAGGALVGAGVRRMVAKELPPVRPGDLKELYARAFGSEAAAAADRAGTSVGDASLAQDISIPHSQLRREAADLNAASRSAQERLGGKHGEFGVSGTADTMAAPKPPMTGDSMNIEGAFGEMANATTDMEGAKAFAGNVPGHRIANDFESGVQRLEAVPGEMTPEQRALWEHYQQFPRGRPGETVGETFHPPQPKVRAAAEPGSASGPNRVSGATHFPSEPGGGFNDAAFAPTAESAAAAIPADPLGLKSALKDAAVDAALYHVMGPLGPLGRRVVGNVLKSDTGAAIIARAMGAINRVNEHITNGMEAFVSGRGPVASTLGAGRRMLSPATFDMLDATTQAGRREALAARAEELSKQAPPQVSPELAQHAPTASTIAMARIVEAQQQLLGRLPKPPHVNPLADPKDQWKGVNDAEVRRFMEMDVALQDPMRVVDQLARGESVRPEILTTLAQVYPTIHARMADAAKRSLLAEMEAGRKVPYARAVQLGRMFGFDGHATASPAAIQAQQAAISANPQDHKQGPKPAKPRGGDTRRSPDPLDPSTPTRLDQLTAR